MAVVDRMVAARRTAVAAVRMVAVDRMAAAVGMVGTAK